jgi:3D (Asp-Asp-Asp) domain-containing protein
VAPLRLALLVLLLSPATATADVSTGYCLHGTMADGSYTRSGSVAHNGYALGTHLTIWPTPTGRRRFVVRDRIGWGTELDFWLPSCGQAIAWGRRTVHVRVGWKPTRR